MSETTERERAAFATAMLGSLELCGIRFHADLMEEGTPWEVACEPEPRFHETLTDAVRFYGELAASELAPLRGRVAELDHRKTCPPLLGGEGAIMSNRTLVELNHDYCPRDSDLLAWAKQLQVYMSSGDKDELPEGVTFKHFRHHSEPDPMERQLAGKEQP